MDVSKLLSWMSPLQKVRGEKVKVLSFPNAFILTLVLLNPDIPCFANSVDPDQLASEEANWSGSALFAIQNVNLYQQSVSRNLIGWKFEKGMAS